MMDFLPLVAIFSVVLIISVLRLLRYRRYRSSGSLETKPSVSEELKKHLSTDSSADSSVFESKLDEAERSESSRRSGLIGFFTKTLRQPDAVSGLEKLLIQADFGPALTKKILGQISEGPTEKVESRLRDLLAGILTQSELERDPWKEKKPWVIFVVGVNGVGKTTTIAKLTHYLTRAGLKVGVLGADTFRKAAQEQVQLGVEKSGADFFTLYGKDGSEGADPAAVVFDGLKKFSNKDAILVDTSGRLHTKVNLMEELKKMKRVAEKAMPGAPHDIWMIIDSTLGQNSVGQVKAFHEAIGLTGVILTKLDGLSRGGTIFQLYQELQLPICFVGLGEGLNDLVPFNSAKFIEELFDHGATSS